MKIYFPIFKVNEIDTTLIKDYLISSYKKELLWSDEGIFEIKNNKLYKKTILDDDINNNILIGNLAAVFDESIFEEDNEWFQIPPSYFNEKIIMQYYKTNNELLKFVIEYETSPSKSNMRDFFFTLKNKGDLENIKGDMNTFLLRLNLCN